MNKTGVWMGMAIVIGAASCGDVESATGDSPSTTGSSALLFSDPTVSGPRLDVYDFNGDVAMSVSGPIGTQTEVLSSLRPDATLVEIYRTLHPTDSSVPSELTMLDQRVGSMIRAAAISPRLAEAAPPVPVEDKSLSAFSSTLCVTFVASATIQYVPVECEWSGNTSIQITGRFYTVVINDRTYGWNNRSQKATMLWYLNGAIFPNAFKDIPPFFWSWGTALTGGPYQVRLFTDGNFGEMGLTHHVMTIVR